LTWSTGLQATDLCQALKCNVPEFGYRQKAGTQGLDKRGLEDVPKRDPVAEAQQSLQSRINEARLIRRVEHLLAQRENLGKFGTHGLLQIPRLGRCHLLC
jgi:hypothetical protein